ncbi:MAG: hypothetical protein R6X35_01145 [Candidatus Krumholzibacteriia bacterium]
MKKLAVLTLCLVGAAIADPTTVAAQCSTGTAHYNTNSTQMMVGEIPGGTTIRVGQQFTVDCGAAQLLDVSFRLTLDSSMVFGAQTCLATGDTMAAVLMDTDHNELARVEQLVTFSHGTQDVVFDFSDRTYGLAAGDYIVVWENVTKSFAFFSKYDGVHPGWLHTETDGTWSEDWFSDAFFAVNWDESGVPVQQLTWGALKADYR